MQVRATSGPCALCARERPLTFHHLIPRTNHRNKWFRKNFDVMDMRTRGLLLCRDCHRKVHQTHDEKTLGRCFNTREALLSDAEIRKFVAWVRKRDH